MTTIKELFEAVGEPIEAKDIREGDLVNEMYDGAELYTAYRASDADLYVGGAYRLLHRPAPTLPTAPGSILGSTVACPRAVLVPGRGWYSFLAEEYRTAEDMQKCLTNGHYIILLDTGATK